MRFGTWTGAALYVGLIVFILGIFIQTNQTAVSPEIASADLGRSLRPPTPTLAPVQGRSQVVVLNVESRPLPIGLIATVPAPRPRPTIGPLPAPIPRAIPTAQPGLNETDRPDHTPEAYPLVRLPVSGPVTLYYGCTAFNTGHRGDAWACPPGAAWFHDGVDFMAPTGTLVRAGLSGRVVFAGPDTDGPLCNQGYSGYGLVVMLDNGAGWQTLYGHLANITVEVGEQVSPERVIGSVGNTGCSTGSHLHFGMKYQGRLMDPLAGLN